MEARDHGALPQYLPAEALRGRRLLWKLWGIIVLVTVVGGGGASIFWPMSSGDRVPPDVDARRQAVFSTLTPIEVPPVGDDDERRLADTMRLPQQDRDLLLKSIREERAAASSMSRATETPAAAAQKPLARASKAMASAPNGNGGSPAKAPRPVTLAQITLWDTDAQDGDVVRIVSSGFEIEVMLAKTPTMLAVPVPPRGVVNVVGVRDGGGGITAGIAVGGRVVELPIMSVGQSLGIAVMARP